MRSLSFFEWRVLYCTLSSNITFFMLGYGYGFPSPIAKEIKNTNILDEYQFGIFSGIFYLAAGLSGLCAMPLMYCLGRKPVIIIAAFICGAGWVVVGFSRIPELLIIGRVVTGLGSGLSIPIVPIYIAELANKNTRGRHLSMCGVGIGAGTFVIFILGIGLNYSWLSYIGTTLCISQIVLLLFAPYTPAYLVRRELDKQALTTLNKIRNNNCDARKEIEEIRDVLREEQIPFASKLALLCKLNILKATFILSLIMVANQSSGVNLFSSYTSQLLENGSIDPNLIGIVFPAGVLISNILNILLIDKVGRKSLFLISVIGTILSLILMGLYFIFIDQICLQNIPAGNSTLAHACQSPSLIAWPMISIILFGTTFAIGCGPIGFIVLGEFIPLKIKHIISGFGTFLLFVTAFLIITLYPIITSNIPRSYFLFGLALFNTILIVLIGLFMPETKGKSIGELEKLFQERTIFCCQIKVKADVPSVI